MKKMIRFIIPMFIFAAFLYSFSASAQSAKCEDGKKMGIAIERTDGEQPDAPKSAWRLPAYKGGATAMCKYLCKNMQYPYRIHIKITLSYY